MSDTTPQLDTPAAVNARLAEIEGKPQFVDEVRALKARLMDLARRPPAADPAVRGAVDRELAALRKQVTELEQKQQYNAAAPLKTEIMRLLQHR